MNAPIEKTNSRRPLVGLTLILALLSATTEHTRADTFRIEIDYMVGGSPNHSHQPSQAVINAVVQMFACQGHTLIVDVSNAVTHYNVLRRNPGNCTQSLFTYSGSADTFGAIKAANFNHAGASPAWHYCLFSHQYEDTSCNTSGSSGLGESPGDDFTVSLGGFSGQTGTLFDQASTLAHEFGHNLGLSHCGSQDCGSDTTTPTYVGPYVPNMPSTMSYRYQLAGVKSNMLAHGLTIDDALFKNIDYSFGRMCSLNEDALNEFSGTIMTSNDFDCDGTLEANVAQDINGGGAGWCGSTGNRTTISDYNEWANISDPLLTKSPEQLQDVREISCITADEWAKVQAEMSQRGHGAQPILTTEPCISGLNVYIGPFFFTEIGSCTFPFDSVQQAHDAAPNNSVFFIKPGTYDAPGAVNLTKPGKYFCNTGTAQFR